VALHFWKHGEPSDAPHCVHFVRQRTQLPGGLAGPRGVQKPSLSLTCSVSCTLQVDDSCLRLRISNFCPLTAPGTNCVGPRPTSCKFGPSAVQVRPSGLRFSVMLLEPAPRSSTTREVLAQRGLARLAQHAAALPLQDTYPSVLYAFSGVAGRKAPFSPKRILLLRVISPAMV
jgi:hypothetical protein